MATANKPDSLWKRLVESYREYQHALCEFLSAREDRVAVLRDALRGPERNLALTAVSSLTEQEKKELFAEWVDLARCAHSPFQPAWDVLLTLPRAWVLERIEPEVNAILQAEEEDDYWMFLQLYEKLSPPLARRLAERAAAHADPDIRELGTDYLTKLPSTPAS